MWHFFSFCNLKAAFFKESTMIPIRITSKQKNNHRRTCSFFICCRIKLRVLLKNHLKSWQYYGRYKRSGRTGNNASCMHINLSNTLLVMMLVWVHTAQPCTCYDIDSILLAIPYTCVYVWFSIDFVKQFIAETHELFSHTQTILSCR